MVAAIAAAFQPDTLAGGCGEVAQHLRRHCLLSCVLEHGLRPLGIGPGLIADGLKALDAVFQRRVVQIGDACLDGVIEPLEAQFRFGRALVEFGDMLAASLGVFLPAVERGGKNRFQPLGLKQLLFKVIDDQIVQLFHRHGHPGAGGRPLPRFHRAGIVAVAPALAGADGHGSAAPGAMDQAGQHGRAADDAGRHDLGIAGLQQLLNRLERLPVDDRRDRHDNDFGLGLEFLGLAALVELMLPHIGAAGQNAVNLTDAPTPAVAGEDAAAVEIGDDVLDAHLTGRAVAFQSKAIDQPHRISMERVDLQLLLDLRAALLGGDSAIADRRQRAVPEALPCILLQGPHDVLGVFLGLVFIEQRHDLPHHDVHGVIAHFLRDRNQLHAVLGQLANVELKLEVIAEEAAERVDDDHIEGRGLRRSRLDHALELGAAVVSRRRAGFDEGFDQLQPARLAIGFALPLLVGNGNIMLGLPRRRDAQIKGGA
ncbi:hypothetical protein L598_001500000870 [Mesorhizobium sp. J18]|uniref:hypothetical protein n=1 Tax=Mesorhizobium sp. J18 TaxID=935263 RepID=UPI001199ECC9|nr:hypothetical protein [Mesorhizobium sp. J18]TWG99364.1 hypothetical protein L598_001500000870 [Mesorhizobium sp. J18]